MTVTVFALLASVLCWPARVRASDRIPRASTSRPAVGPMPALRAPVVVVAVTSIVAFVLLGGPWWLSGVLAVGTAAGARMRPVDATAPDEIPLVADLMATCLSAGSSLADALSAAVAAAGPQLRGKADRVVSALRSGAPPAEAWGDWLTDDNLAPVARTCIRTAGSGAAAAAELVRLAARMRAAHRAQRQQRVARAAVWIVLPLGGCFLPAFVAVGVVPLVASLLQRLH